MAAAGSKRSLFNKPAWASKSSSAKAGTEPIFGRNQVYEDIVEAERKRREIREAKARERARQEKDSVDRNPKRRRVSDEVEDEDDGEDSDAQSVNTTASGKSLGTDKPKGRPVTRSTPQKEKLVDGLDHSLKAKSPRKPKSQPATIVLDDDEDKEADETYSATTAKPKSPIPQKPNSKPSEFESDEEDEHIQELKRKAKERARLKSLGTNQDRANTPTSTSIPSRSVSADPATSASVPSPAATPMSPANNENDPYVSIFISTIIPNAVNIIVKRKASQDLKQVKDYWCQRMDLDPAIAAKVFFTWRSTRLWDSTTMRGILRRLQAASQTTTDPSKGKIEIEAVIPEIFELRQKQRQRKLAETAGFIPEEEAENEDAERGERENADETPVPDGDRPSKKDGVVIRLVIQDKSVEPLALRVRPNTSVGKIMLAFKATAHIDRNKTCWLVFDGDRLEPEATVQHIGFEQDDTVEVHVR